MTNNNGIFPTIPAEVSLAIHDCVCTQLGINSDSQDEPIRDSDETFVCSECGEWTSEEDVLDGDAVGGTCCGVGPSNHEYERDYER